MPLLAAPLTIAFQLSHADIGEPFPSPDGKHLVYEMMLEGHYQLFVMDVDGKNPKQLTHDPVTHDTPSWSPDGKRIAFMSDADGHEAIHVIDADGTHEERITPPGSNYIHPTWSPDGKRLVYCSDDDLKPPRKTASDIFEIELATRKVKTLITGGTSTYPSWSPDGTKLAFRRMIGDMNSEVFVANADGSGQKNISNHMAFDGWPAWSPDGKLIAFSSNRNANYQIHVMKPDGSDVKLVANTEGRATEPRWAPDGKTIYFTNCTKVGNGIDCAIMSAPLTR